MFRMIPRMAFLPLGGFQNGFFSTGADVAVMTPGLGRLKRSQRAPESAAETKWDLVRSASALRAQGAQILHLFGEVLDFDCNPVPEARVEIWQAGPDCRYRDEGTDERDPFRGFGSAVTDVLGHFMFRTILPVAYPGRAPHIHARVTRPNGRILETQIYLVDAPENDRDWHYGSLGPSQQAALSIDPVERADGNLDAGFNFVV